MKLKSTLLAVLLTSLGLAPLTTLAADAAAVAKPEAKTEKAGKVVPHNHMTEKTGIPVAKNVQTGAPKTPLHDHRKEHK